MNELSYSTKSRQKYRPFDYLPPRGVVFEHLLCKTYDNKYCGCTIDGVSPKMVQHLDCRLFNGSASEGGYDDNQDGDRYFGDVLACPLWSGFH